jgi:hypothetical protein
MMRLLLPIAVVVGVVGLAAPPASAQTGEGEGEGEGECTPFCEGNTLHFCDVGEQVTLTCGTDVGARCGVVSEEWGADCLLGEGEPCDPDFAGGVSRCDREAGLFCVDEVCTAASGPPPAEGPLEPTEGTASSTTSTTSSTDIAACLGCSGDSTGALLVGAFFLKRLGRRRR